MKKYFLIAAILLSCFHAERARAISFVDAALTVGISAGVGAVLGLSTLPFYEDSGAHTGNILTGAAIGAVVGVGIAAFSAVSSEDGMQFEEEYEDAEKKDFSFNFRIKKKINKKYAHLIQEQKPQLLAFQRTSHVIAEQRFATSLVTVKF